jgi:predicted nucleic acid-binding protein
MSNRGYIDAHLVTTALAAGAHFWTRDKRLATAIAGLGILYSPPPAA